MRTSEQIDAMASALSKAQGQLRPALKDATNPHFRSKYADLASVVDVIRKPLADNGLSVLQEAATADGVVGVTTRVLHSSGQWIEMGPLCVPTSKMDAHGVGSAVTYAKRYALSAALGIAADEDDDGNAAVARPTEPAIDEVAYRAWLGNLSITAKASTFAELVETVNAGREEFKARLRSDKKAWADLKSLTKPEVA